ncbi:MAG: OmpA family protein [Betaproteobacteria bacterium]|nr:MAG: OmpA family protein [Betaproteobacteria bacterium]
MQRKANRLLLLLIGAALAACQATTEQGSSGAEEEFYDIPPSKVDVPPPDPEPIQYTEAELGVGNLGPVDYAEETVSYEEEYVGETDTGVSEPDEYYDYPTETVEYSEEDLGVADTGISEPEEYYDYPTETIEYAEETVADAGTGVSDPSTRPVEAPMEFPVTSYEVTEEPEITDLGAIEQPIETLSYAEEYVPDEGAGVSEAQEYVMEEEVPELGPVAVAEETLSFEEEEVAAADTGVSEPEEYYDYPTETIEYSEEALYQEESVGDVTSYESVTVSAEAQPLFEFDRSEVRMDEQWKLEGFVTELAGADFETVWVVGHADRIGTVEYNQGLSERRASAVKAFLVKLGIADDKISTSGRSELMPITSDGQCKGIRGNALIECLQPDRRVEVSVSAEVVREVIN